MGNSPTGLIYTESYKKYDFGKGHPLKPIRIKLFYSLLSELGLLSHKNLEKITPRNATEEEILKIHTKRYVEKLKELSKENVSPYHSEPEFGLGLGDNPIFPGMYNAAMAVAGSSLSAAEYIMEENNHKVFNPLGGLHHAMPNMASGFCIFNDVAIAIQYLLDHNPNSRIMYLDIDCHHGDGVQWIFYDKPEVLTLSFHQDGKTLFPGTGFIKERGKGRGEGFSFNVPLRPGTVDEIYINTFTKIVPEIMEIYKPDFLVCQLGVDTHFTDPLTDMRLTTSGHEKLFHLIHEYSQLYAHDKLLALGGGGYNVDVVARSWTLLMGELLDVKIPDELPEAWLKELSSVWKESELPHSMRDRVPELEAELMKDPYYLQVLEQQADQIVDEYETKLIPELIEKMEIFDK